MKHKWHRRDTGDLDFLPGIQTHKYTIIIYGMHPENDGFTLCIQKCTLVMYLTDINSRATSGY